MDEKLKAFVQAQIKKPKIVLTVKDLAKNTETLKEFKKWEKTVK